MKIKALISMVIIFLFSGCAVSDTFVIKNVVKKYDQKLVAALSQGNPEVLKDYATEDERGRVYIFISELLKKNRLLKARLIKLKFLEARKVTSQEVEELLRKRKERLEKQKLFTIPVEVAKVPYALVRTEETWKYTYIDASSGRPVSEETGVSYQNSYFLIMENDKWFVDRIDAVEVPPKK